MSERSLSPLLTFTFFLTMAVWIPFLDSIARFIRHRKQSRRIDILCREVEADLPRLYDLLRLIGNHGKQVCMHDKP